ncbi:hypothetical protein Q2T83_16375 [Fervidibacter sacchari]|uniref:Uncharacterized protein n=1 Tax=Candidatus Fervidibacter sacchari TaxID=1448929 RepID=A0ABT2EKT4_9BACT|nr:hypothetical protein [Candidatus Fervidibacter sacchari]MCS3918086.1 hypothetical protein [Candidatus Fervidibacter sacchari]WKU15894.1 hypothetical protein Q2T83_16375 [Candidatus Fervidibacter sacchari]
MAAFNIFVVAPASAKVVEAMTAEMAKAMPPSAPAFPVMPISPWMEFWSVIVQLLWLLLYSAWALVALFLLLLPDARKAF